MSEIKVTRDTTLKDIYPNYYNQCAGITIESGKAIFINGFSKESWKNTSSTLNRYSAAARKKIRSKFSNLVIIPPDIELVDWRWFPMSVCHGKKDYFGVVYSVKDKKFMQFMFNY